MPAPMYYNRQVGIGARGGPAGIVRATGLRTAAEALQSIGVTIDRAIVQPAAQSLANQRQKEGALAGYGAVQRDDKGNLTVAKASEGTIYGEAFNKSARTAYLAQFAQENRAKAAEFQAKYREPTAFQAAWKAHQDEFAKSFDGDPELTLVATQELAQMGEQTHNAIATKWQSEERSLHKQAIEAEMTSLEADMGNLADAGQSGPEFAQAAAKYRAGLQGMVESRLIPQEAAEAKMRELDGANREKLVRGTVMREFTALGTSQAQRKYAERFAAEGYEDSGLTYEEHEKIAVRLDREVTSTRAAERAQRAEIDRAEREQEQALTKQRTDAALELQISALKGGLSEADVIAATESRVLPPSMARTLLGQLKGDKPSGPKRTLYDDLAVRSLDGSLTVDEALEAGRGGKISGPQTVSLVNRLRSGKKPAAAGPSDYDQLTLRALKGELGEAEAIKAGEAGKITGTQAATLMGRVKAGAAARAKTSAAPAAMSDYDTLTLRALEGGLTEKEAIEAGKAGKISGPEAATLAGRVKAGIAAKAKAGAKGDDKAPGMSAYDSLTMRALKGELTEDEAIKAGDEGAITGSQAATLAGRIKAGAKAKAGGGAASGLSDYDALTMRALEGDLSEAEALEAGKAGNITGTQAATLMNRVKAASPSSEAPAETGDPYQDLTLGIMTGEVTRADVEAAALAGKIEPTKAKTLLGMIGNRTYKFGRKRNPDAIPAGRMSDEQTIAARRAAIEAMTNPRKDDGPGVFQRLGSGVVHVKDTVSDWLGFGEADPDGAKAVHETVGAIAKPDRNGVVEPEDEERAVEAATEVRRRREAQPERPPAEIRDEVVKEAQAKKKADQPPPRFLKGTAKAPDWQASLKALETAHASGAIDDATAEAEANRLMQLMDEADD